jgi:hypothetical protein
MFALGKETGKYAVFIYQWSQPDILDVAQKVVKMSEDAGLTPIVAISPTVLGGFRSEYDAPQPVQAAARKRKLSMEDKDVREPYMAAVLELAKMKVPYLCLATEINMMAFKDVQEYIRFAAIYKAVYPLVKQISPQTKVFVSFQWDIYRVLDEKEPKKIDEHTKLIDIFRPQLDVVAFTTYPSTQFSNPAQLPLTYYSDLKRHTKPSDEIMFMEVGWPTSGKGSESQQLQFIGLLPKLMAGVRPNILLWALLHDVTGVLNADLASTGLLTTEGRRKPSLEAFKELRNR